MALPLLLMATCSLATWNSAMGQVKTERPPSFHFSSVGCSSSSRALVLPKYNPMMVSRLVGLSPLSTSLGLFSVQYCTRSCSCSPGITAAAQLIPSFLLIWSSVQKRCLQIGMACASWSLAWPCNDDALVSEALSRLLDVHLSSFYTWLLVLPLY